MAGVIVALQRSFMVAFLVGAALGPLGCSTSVKKDPVKRDQRVTARFEGGVADRGSARDGTAFDKMGPGDRAPWDLIRRPDQPKGADLAKPDKGKLPDKSKVPDQNKLPDKAKLPDLPRPPDQSKPPDKAKIPDGPSPTGCDPACVSADPTTCVKDSTGTCVECLTSAHCKQNPGALGPICDTAQHYCICLGTADCALNNWGHNCDSSGYYWCYCGADTECTTSPFGKKCHPLYDTCGCVGNADCKAPNLTCNTSWSICVP